MNLKKRKLKKTNKKWRINPEWKAAPYRIYYAFSGNEKEFFKIFKKKK